MIKARILDISVYKPQRVVTNEDLENLINREKKYLSKGVLQKIFGIEERRFAAKEEMVSDLAAKAAQPLLERQGKEGIDFLIFAAACSDLIEPATSNIIQKKLGLNCPCMDIKNACNSFVSAIQTASAFIQAGMYKKILILNGEKLSVAINLNIQNSAHLKKSLAAFSLGDAGAAALIGESEDENRGIYYQKFMTDGKYWDLCTIQGGGSMYPHDGSKNYFEGKTAALRTALLKSSKTFLSNAFKEANCAPKDVDWLFTHQVSTQTFDLICKNFNIDRDKCISVFEHFGNTAAASIPLSFVSAIEQNKLKKGDRIAIIGLAAGISASLQLMIW